MANSILGCTCCFFWLSQILVWIFDALFIIFIITFSNSYFDPSNVDFMIAIFMTGLINYIFYLLLNFIVYDIKDILGKKISINELINKIKELNNDNTFSFSTIEYECFHYLKSNEQRNKNTRYIEDYKGIKAITKSDSLSYDYKSMTDTSENIHINTLGYSIITIYLNVIVEMDEETKKDFEETKEGFIIDCKNVDELFESKIKHNYLKNNYSAEFFVISNNLICSYIFSPLFYKLVTILGFAEIMKCIINKYISNIQYISIKKIISSKYNLNNPNISQQFGYDKLSPKIYINNEPYENNNSNELLTITPKSDGNNTNEEYLLNNDNN